MHTLIVVSHPTADSLTHAVAHRIAEGVRSSSRDHSVEIADLAAEQFDPRFSSGDLGAHLQRSVPPEDVLAEQARIDRADALVLVYPIYWWSMPALLKGWIDRVFSNGWAYDDRPGAALAKKLGHLRVHLVAIGGADLTTYARHGYFGAMRTQIDHGIFGYCGAQVVSSDLLVSSDSSEAHPHLATAHAIGRNLTAIADPRAA